MTERCDHMQDGKSTKIDLANNKGEVCLRCHLFFMKSKLGWFERFMLFAFPHTDIMRDNTDEIYLRRFFLYPRDKDFGKNKGKGRLYLHKFYKGDEDPHLHNHPWKFTSLILTRGYWEETPLFQPGDKMTVKNKGYIVGRDGEWFKRIFYGAFSILKRPAVWKHRVVLKDLKPVWTLVRTGVKEQSWGFWILGKLCPWRSYNDGVCWCEACVGVSHKK